MCLSPSTPATASSIRFAMSFSISDGVAPSQVVETVTYGISICGSSSKEIFL